MVQPEQKQELVDVLVRLGADVSETADPLH
jgi:hypothetical protein